MRKSLIVFSILFASFGVAEPKRLVCETSNESDVATLLEIADRFDSSYAEKAQICEEFGEYGYRNTYTFDTEGLTNSQYSKVEASRVSCLGYDSGVVAGSFSATPAIISFHVGDDENFNVDRKTLGAGYDTNRDYKCKLEDVDTSDNLI